MQEAFTWAHEFTVAWEGGLSEHPQDAGGITHYGVSYAWLQQLEEKHRQEAEKLAATADGCNAWDAHDMASPYDFNSDGIVNKEDIRACTANDAKALFYTHFWQALHCAKLPLALAVVLYDSAVNMGGPRAVRLLQEACNVVGEAHLDEFTSLKEDGICGAKTWALAKALQEHGLDFYTARLCVRRRVHFYGKIVQKNPKNAVFLQGWKNRCQALLEHLALMERDIS